MVFGLPGHQYTIFGWHKNTHNTAPRWTLDLAGSEQRKVPALTRAEQPSGGFTGQQPFAYVQIRDEVAKLIKDIIWKLQQVET